VRFVSFYSRCSRLGFAAFEHGWLRMRSLHSENRFVANSSHYLKLFLFIFLCCLSSALSCICPLFASLSTCLLCICSSLFHSYLSM
jgi:hypothetical protein